MKKESSYQNNFIEGVKMMMAKESLETLKEAATFLGLSYMGLYKVMDKSNKPTVEHGIILCTKAGYSANWLFLSKGSVYYKDEIDLKEIKVQLDNINASISKK